MRFKYLAKNGEDMLVDSTFLIPANGLIVDVKIPELDNYVDLDILLCEEIFIKDTVKDAIKDTIEVEINREKKSKRR